MASPAQMWKVPGTDVASPAAGPDGSPAERRLSRPGIAAKVQAVFPPRNRCWGPHLVLVEGCGQLVLLGLDVAQRRLQVPDLINAHQFRTYGRVESREPGWVV